MLIRLNEFRKIRLVYVRYAEYATLRKTRIRKA